MKRLALLELLCRLSPEQDPEELRARVLCGEVSVDGQRIRDPRAPVPAEGASIAFQQRRFVSRGGRKLEGALQGWGVSVSGLCLLDAGCSTGGFTDCLLQRGARRVIAVDVGYGQLDYSLRRDPRVSVLERTNIRELTVELLPERPQGAVADLSFRSLRGAASRLLALTADRWLIALVKPQFEWRKPPSGFRGVVHDRRALGEILADLVCDLEREGAFLQRAAPSVLSGAKGNREFFFYLSGEAGSNPQALAGLLGE
jgi:23S rRNA (cytidine1920-2'-O)/16S rRNA (cytidine1409-2'-O)-methyltransferase